MDQVHPTIVRKGNFDKVGRAMMLTSMMVL